MIAVVVLSAIVKDGMPASGRKREKLAAWMASPPKTMRKVRISVARASKSGNAANASSVPTDASHERAAERAVRGIKQQGTLRNTLRAVDTAERYRTAWYRLRYRSDPLPMPVPTDVIIQFIVDHSARASPDAGVPTCELPPKVDRALIALGVKKEGLLSFLRRLASGSRSLGD